MHCSIILEKYVVFSRVVNSTWKSAETFMNTTVGSPVFNPIKAGGLILLYK